METTSQLEEWKGEFGQDYIARNQITEDKLKPGTTAFGRMLHKATGIDSIFEIGANIGLNQYYLNSLFKGSVSLNAIEPNEQAYAELVNGEHFKLDQSWNCAGFELPCEDASFDLVFTSRVLIHIAPEDLLQMTSEIVRVSKKYVLCCEYFNDNPITINYRGKDGLLFKRDFGKFYLENFPNLKWVDYGFVWREELWPAQDNANWWLFEKTDA